MSRNLTESLISEGLQALKEQLPTNTKAMNKSVKDMLSRLSRDKGAMDIARFKSGSNDALGASLWGSGTLRSLDADGAAGMYATDAQAMADYVKKRGSGTLRAQYADGDRNYARGIPKPYMQAYLGKGRQR